MALIISASWASTMLGVEEFKVCIALNIQYVSNGHASTAFGHNRNSCLYIKVDEYSILYCRLHGHLFPVLGFSVNVQRTVIPHFFKKVSYTSASNFYFCSDTAMEMSALVGRKYVTGCCWCPLIFTQDKHRCFHPPIWYFPV